MVKIECRFLLDLIEKGEISSSKVSKRIKDSDLFLKLIESQALIVQKRGAGEVLIVDKMEVLDNYLRFECPKLKRDESRGERYNNIRVNRNSKSNKRKSYRLAFVRGLENFTLNKKSLSSIEPIGEQIERLEAKKICLVENLENFMEDKRFIYKGYILIYPIGRFGKELLNRLSCEELVMFGDLDYVGLNEFTRVKHTIPNATLYIPDGYFEDALKYGLEIKSNQKASLNLIELSKVDDSVKSVLDFLQKSNLFLEQEGYDD
jgi:hypothetical protein